MLLLLLPLQAAMYLGFSVFIVGWMFQVRDREGGGASMCV